MGAANIGVKAVKVMYGEDVAQIEKIITRADTALETLNNKWFMLYTPAGAKHVFYFDTGTAVAPVVPDATVHQVVIVALDSAAAVATALNGVINPLTPFNSVVSGNEITVTHGSTGYASQALDGAAPTQFGLEIVVQGDLVVDLGCMEGNIEVAFEESFLDVKCHESGVTPIAQLKTGVSNVEITMSALETTKAQLKKLFTYTGGSFTPTNGTEVFGMGTYKNFENMFKYAKKLVLHPVNRLAGDKSEDLTFHKAIPNLSGLTFSGEETFKVPLTFKVFPAENVNSRVNYWSYGDGSQNLA